MILYITQNSFYFVHKYFLTFFEKENCEVIYVIEKKRGIIKKYKEIFYYFGFWNTFISFLYEIICLIKFFKRERKVISSKSSDKYLNIDLEQKLKSHKFKKIISIGCPCKIDAKLQDKYNIEILNLHGGIIPFQNGRFSPIKSLKKKHKYLGATLHIISDNFDSGEILSQNFFEIKNNNILKNYSKVLFTASKLLEAYLNGKKKIISSSIINDLKFNKF